MNSDFRNNFSSMPALLKLIVASSLLFPIFIAASTFPHSSVNVFGQLIPIEIWWANGGGASIVLVGLVMCAASWLMLKRAARARLVYASGWTMLIVLIPVLGVRFNVTWDDIIFTSISNTVLMAVLIAYLYLNRAVRKYFGNPALR